MTLDPTEFELGEDVTEHVKRSRSPGLVVSARLDREDARRLFALAKKTDRTPSQIAREALRRYIADSEKAPVFGGEATFGTAGVWLSDTRPLKLTGSLVHWQTRTVVGTKTPIGSQLMAK